VFFSFPARTNSKLPFAFTQDEVVRGCIHTARDIPWMFWSNPPADELSCNPDNICETVKMFGLEIKS